MAATTPRHAAAANGNHDGEDEPPAARAGLPCANATLSPWLKEPSKRLLGHRSTAELPGSADVVVVGSGITGAFAAHFLKAGVARGQSVVMLEAREACWGASGRTTGLIEPRLFAATMEGAAFEAESYRLVRDIVRVAGIKCDWVDSTCLYFNEDPLTTFGEAMMDEFAERFPALNTLLGIQRLRAAAAAEDDGEEDEEKHGKGEGKEGGAAAEGRLLAEAIRERLGRVGVDAADGCITMPNAATMNPYKLVTWLLEHLLDEFDADEFALHTNTPVTALAPSSGGSGGGSGWTLTTPRGEMRAAKVLLATNGYTSALLPAFADLISPVRAQACALVPKPGGAAAAAAAAAAGGGPRIDLARCAYNFVAADGSHDSYIIQRPRDGTGGGELISDGARHLAPGRGVGEWRDDAADADVAAHLRALLRRVVDANGGQGKAEFGDAADEEDATALDWTGVMGFSRDRIPWVGRVPESHGGGPGLFLCAAYTGRGLTVAPLCARWVAHDMMAAEGGGGEGGGGGAAAATAEEAAADADDPPMSNMPAGFRIDLPGRLETVEDEWPDVATIEEGGSALVLQTVIHKLMTKWCGYGDCYDGAPPKLAVHGTLRTIQQAYDELVGGGGRGHGHVEK